MSSLSSVSEVLPICSNANADYIRHNCPFHGEIREEPGSGPESDTESQSRYTSQTRMESDIDSSASEIDEPADSDTDSDSEIINFKKHVNAAPREHPENALTNGHTSHAQQPKYSINFWLTKTETYLLHKRRPFYPCSHEGSCEEAHCRCFREKIACEKTCACPSSCKRRFRGCTCARDSRVRVCWKNPKCECSILNRECDADLCGTCGAAEVLDPVNRYDEHGAKDKCANVYIQRNLPKRTLLGHSEVQGFGLYIGEKVKADDYLGEYKGEIITNGEAGRRGAIYHHLRTNYLFNLNKGRHIFIAS